MKRQFVRSDSGHRLVVIRPATRELAETAVAMAKIAAAKNDEAIFQSIPAEIADYTFVGFLGRHPRSGKTSVIDASGAHLGELLRGDSFVDEGALANMEASN